MGGSGGSNKANFKGSDAEDMCSAGSLDSDPRYQTCCSNVCTPGRVLRDMVVGLLVVIGIAAIVAAIFAVCFFLVPEERKFYETELLADAEGVIGGPPPTPKTEPEPEPEPESEPKPDDVSKPINPTDADRYDIPPVVEKVQTDPPVTHTHSHHEDHSGHTHSHSDGDAGHTHDHSGHTHTHPHDHSGHTHTHPHDHSGHTHTHPHEHSGNTDSHDHSHDHDAMLINKLEEKAPSIIETTPGVQIISTEESLGHSVSPADSGLVDHTTTNNVVFSKIEEEIPYDQIATASIGHPPAVFSEKEKEETFEPARSQDRLPSINSGPLFDVLLGPRQTSENPTTEVTSTTSESTSPKTTTQESIKTTTSSQAPTTVSSVPSELGVCLPSQLPLCSSATPWTTTSFPNWINGTSFRDTLSSLPYFRDIVINSRCSPRALEYTCAVLEPSCHSNGQPLPPCRAFCRSVASTCSEFLIKNSHQNMAFDCNRFPDSDDPSVCVDLAEGVCLQVEHQCPSTGNCIGPRLVCDGVRDCADGSDETNCPNATSGTQTSAITTPSPTEAEKLSHSTPETWNMPFTFPITPPTVEETTIIEEEATETVATDPTPELTSSSTPTTTCPQLQCLDGKCITLEQLNDGVNDCSDGSDEQDFSAILSGTR